MVNKSKTSNKSNKSNKLNKTNKSNKSKKSNKTKKTKGGSGESSKCYDCSGSVLLFIVPFLLFSTIVIIFLFQKVQCPVKDKLTMKVDELPKDQIVLIAAKDLKNGSMVSQPGSFDNNNDIALSDDLPSTVPVMAIASEIYPGTSLEVETLDNVWVTIPYTKVWASNKEWIPLNDVRACSKQCLEHEWCKTMGVSKYGKCYATPQELHSLPEDTTDNSTDATDTSKEAADGVNDADELQNATNATNTSLIIKYNAKDHETESTV